MRYTFVILDIHASEWERFATKMRAAGYDHVFSKVDGRPVIDMHGIALAPEARVSPEECANRSKQDPSDLAGFNLVARSNHCICRARAGLCGLEAILRCRRCSALFCPECAEVHQDSKHGR